MKLKRILSGMIGFPIVALILIFGNIYVIDVIFAIVALIAMSEYLNAFKKEAKPVKWIAYLACLPIAFLHIIQKEYYVFMLAITIAVLMGILFIKVIISNMKTKIFDIMITFFGIFYIVFFLLFIPLLYGVETGKYLIWYIFIVAWGTDTCAYFIGSKLGKHKISKISPKKSLEGCIRRNNGGCNAFYYLHNLY